MPGIAIFQKLFFYCISLSVVILLVAMIRDTTINRKSDHYGDDLQGIRLVKDDTYRNDSQVGMKYILLWTGRANSPLAYMGQGQKGFIESKCPMSNCYVTDDRTLFSGDYTVFDAVAFYGPHVANMYRDKLPQKRSSHQKYIFATIESADNYPVCSGRLDGFFNWTWTYKLDSDARWGYVVVRDANGEIVGPKAEMHWISQMEPIGEDLKDKLKSKKKAAAWFASNCATRSGRENLVKEVQKHLQPFGLTVDVYGRCGPLKCPRDNMDDCLKKLEEDYYFYLSFENSFSEDYVTEKLIHALQHDTVPVVFGGANYTRFMPDGVYLNARELDAQQLAQTMHDIIQDPDRYHSYFRYKNHYSFWRRMQSVETNDYCLLCAMLNDHSLVNETTVYDDFGDWWNTKTHTRC